MGQRLTICHSQAPVSTKATIERVETDSDGVYEAHIVTADGQRVIVQVGKAFTVTGTQSDGGPGGGHGGGPVGPPPSQGGQGN